MLKSKATKIKIEDIVVGKRERTELGDLKELKESIAELGLINPITVLKIEDKYHLLAGARRLQACTELEHTTVPATIYENLDTIDKLYIELDENYQRLEFTYAEEVALKKRIYEMEKSVNPKTSIRKLADKLDTNRESLSVDIQLAEAIEFMPELAKCKNKHEALKKFDLFEAEVAKQVLGKKMATKLKTDPTEKLAVLNSLYVVGDTLELLPKEKTLEYSVVELDPPYGIEYEKLSQDGLAKKYFDGWNKKEFLTNMPIVLKESHRILKANGWLLLWYSMRYHCDLMKMLAEVGFKLDPTPIIWNKSTGRSNSPRTMFNQSAEFCIYARKGSPSLQIKGHNIIFSHKVEQDESHATPKPIALYEELLETFAVPGSKVFSGFLGSGNIILAAYNKGLMCKGIDKFEENKNDFLMKGEKLL